MNTLAGFRASGIRVILFEDDSITTFCDRCGCEIPLAEANCADPELPSWVGATLCNECYAAEQTGTSPQHQ